MPADPTRLLRIRNYQSSEFWAILFARPAAIALLWLVADWRWVTPNRLTIAAFGLTCAGAGLVAFGSRDAHLAAAAVLNLALVLDNADGTLARYRKTTTAFGGYLDKVLDAASQIVVGVALSWAGYRASGEPRLLLVGPTFAAVLILRGYAKWVVAHAQDVARSPDAIRADVAPVAPPERTPLEWAKLVGQALSRMHHFEEVDLPFWIALGLVTGRIPALLYVLLGSQVLWGGRMLVKRGLQARRLDAQRG